MPSMPARPKCNEIGDGPFLVADVGGTHLTLALVRSDSGRFRLLRKTRFATQQESTILSPIQRFLAEDPSSRPIRACFAGAGPLTEGRLSLTNAPWELDAAALEGALDLPVRLINDFTALTLGALHLDLADSGQVIPLPHGDGSLPSVDRQGPVLVVGAGTGLGVGFAVTTPEGFRVFPSEGGHIGLPVFDEDSIDLWRHLDKALPGPPGAELAVSGPGIGRIYRFLIDTQRTPRNPKVDAILALPAGDQPQAIAAGAASDPACGRALSLFVALYARVCADLCAVFMPTGGLFLAGGVTARNEAHFLEGDRFMLSFERNYLPHLNHLTRGTPVHLVRNYDISLFGAAQALVSPWT